MRTTFTDPDGALTWFDPQKSRWWAAPVERDLPIARVLYHTPSDRWIVETDSRRVSDGPIRYEEIDPDAARLWLIQYGYGDDVEQLFGPVPDDPVAPPHTVRLGMPPDLVARIDADAAAGGVSRAEWIRRACVSYLG